MVNIMKALVKEAKGPNNIKLIEVPVPSPKENEVLIRVKAAGICGTDLHIKKDAFPYYPPVILGHEFSGEIVALGKNVKQWKVGERVVAEPHTQACGVCRLCRSGYSHLCPHKRSPGWGINGAFAEYVVMPFYLLHRIPEHLSYESAATIEPFAITLHAVERGGIEPGSNVIIFGAGPIGLLSAKVARICGASQIVIVGTNQDKEYRFKIAEKIPVDEIVNVEETDPLERVEKITKGAMADIVIEASGSPNAVSQTTKMLRKRGKIIVLGITEKESVNFPWKEAMTKALDMHFSFSSSHEAWIKAINLIEGKVADPGIVVTHTLPLEKWETAFKMSEEGKCGKIILTP